MQKRVLSVIVALRRIDGLIFIGFLVRRFCVCVIDLQLCEKSAYRIVRFIYTFSADLPWQCIAPTVS